MLTSTQQYDFSDCFDAEELEQLARYWFSVIQASHFCNEMCLLKMSNGTKATDNEMPTDINQRNPVPNSSTLSSLNPFLDAKGIRVGGRQQNANFTYNSRHPIILHSKHPLVKLLIRSEHARLLHGGSLPSLVIFTSLADTEPFILSLGAASPSTQARNLR